ncbi:MAG: tetratricopeptide repeat-containing glycosyltransferase [Gaiellaceae bacterium]
MRADTTGQTIGLCMIVRNEAEIVERCIASVIDLVDTWVICDTGSTDATRDVVRTALATKPGVLHELPWTDFGRARTELLTLARGTADYLLLIDADMTVLQRGDLPPLAADAYMLRETGSLDFGVIRLVRGDRRWWFEGSTHEYIATDGRFDQEQLDSLLIEHHADGAARPQKLIRDVGLLKRDLARNPENARAVFYLAQTFRDLGKHELAIEYYRRRVEMRGWNEEVFYANLQEGILKAERDLDWGVPVLLEAWQRRPTRAEPLYELARLYRARGDVSLAHLFASRGLEVAYPNDTLFIHRFVYDWGILLERALAAAELGRIDEAAADLHELELREHLPEHVLEFVRDGLANLDERNGRRMNARSGGPERLSALAPSLRMGEIKLDVKPSWPCFNPSVAADGDAFRMIVRTANYQIERGVLHSDGILQNVNYLLALDRDLGVTSIEPIVDRSEGLRRYHSQVQGYEDCRLIEFDGRWYATATVSELNPTERREVALLELDGPDIVAVHPLRSPRRGRHEKNWMPFVAHDSLAVVYSCGPTVVLRCDPASGNVEPISRRSAPPFAAEFRGGSQGIPVENGHLFVVHEVDRSEAKLRYLHRFVLLGDDLAISALSRPFTFISDRVEFCAGLARQGDSLILSFGVSDAAAGLAVVSTDEALGLLEPRRRRAHVKHRQASVVHN